MCMQTGILASSDTGGQLVNHGFNLTQQISYSAQELRNKLLKSDFIIFHH